MNLSKPNIEVKWDAQERKLTLSSSTFSYYTYLYLDKSNDTTLKFSDNFFDLSP